MLLNYTGFEAGPIPETQGRIQSDIVKSGGFSLYLDPSNIHKIGFNKKNIETLNAIAPVLYSRFWVRYEQQGEFFSHLDKNGNKKARLIINSEGIVEIHIGDFVKPGPYLKPQEWHLIEFKTTTGLYGVYHLKCKGIITEGTLKALTEPVIGVQFGNGFEGYIDDVVLDDAVFPTRLAKVVPLKLSGQKFNKFWTGRPPRMITDEANSSAFYRLKNDNKFNKILAIKAEAAFDSNRRCYLQLKKGTSMIKSNLFEGKVSRILEKDIKTNEVWTRRSLNRLELGLFADNKPGKIICNHLGIQMLCY